MLLFIIFSMDFCLALTIIERKNSLVNPLSPNIYKQILQTDL